MASVTIHQQDDSALVEVDRLTLPEGDSFLVLQLGMKLSIVLAGADHEAVARARAIAAALTVQADALDDHLRLTELAGSQSEAVAAQAAGVSL